MINFLEDEPDYEAEAAAKTTSDEKEDSNDFDFALPDVEEEILSSGDPGVEQEIDLNVPGGVRKKWKPRANRPKPTIRRRPITEPINIPDFALPGDDNIHVSVMLDELEDSISQKMYDDNILPKDEYNNTEIAEMDQARFDDEEEHEVIEAFKDSTFTQIDDDDEEDEGILSILARIESPGGAISSLNRDDDEDVNFRVTEEEVNILKDFNIDEIISLGIELKASDIHITVDEKVSYTVNGDLVWSNQFPPIPMEVTRIIQQAIVTNVSDSFFIEQWELDTSYVVKTGKYEGRRVRLNVSRKEEGANMTMRIISDTIPTPEELSIEDTLLKWTRLPNGLILMNGPTGTGKALGLSTKLKQPRGKSITMADVNVGDVLIDSFNNPCVVTGLSSIDYHPILFKLSLTNGITAIADSNHQWIVSSKESRSLFAHSDFQGLEEYNTRFLIESEVIRSLKNNSYEGFVFSNFVEVLNNHLPHYHFTGDNLSQLERFLEISFQADYVEAFEVMADRWAATVEYGVSSQFRVLTLAEMSIMGFEVEFNFPFVQSKNSIHDEYYAEEQFAIESIEEIGPSSVLYEPVKCISVDSPDSSYVLDSGLVTHNSTTLASMIQNLKYERACKIISIEKPIEYEYVNDGKALIQQREVGRDTLSFSAALDSAMRSKPDVIIIGEARNKVEVDALLYAADTGHLTISTMHSTSAPDTITRIKALFSGDEQTRVLSSLATSTRGFANQVLVKTKDGKSRFAVREILEIDYDIASLIEIGDSRGIRKIQEERGITLEHKLFKAVVDGKCTADEALFSSTHPLLFNKLLDEYYA